MEHPFDRCISDQSNTRYVSLTPNCLIISPHFPPSTLAGVHRARHLVKHLPAHGWRAKVICVEPSFHIERLDPALATLVPDDVSIIRVGALPINLTRPLGIAGDIGLRGFSHIRAAIEREMRTDRPDVVMITGSPFFPMLLAGWIKRRWGVPVVLDFQDPWVTPVGAAARIGSKAWLAHRLAVIFEPKAVRHAAFITSVSDKQNEELASRYPFLDRSRMAGIPIGGDPEDFAGFTKESRCDAQPSSELVSIVYTGTVWQAAVPVLQKLLAGAKLACNALANTNYDLRFLFMGTTANPNPSGDYRVLPYAQSLGIEDRIIEIPERRPFLEAVKAMTRASVNLIIGSEEPHYTASKIFPILMADRPHLSVLHKESSSHRILDDAGGGIALSFNNAEDLEVLPDRIAEAIITLATNPSSVGRVNPAAYAEYTARAVVGKFAVIFEHLRIERSRSCLEQRIV